MIATYYDYMQLRMEHPFVKKIKTEITRVPLKANKNAVDLWRGISRTDFKLFIKYWVMIEPEMPLFDGHQQYESWTNEFGAKCVGLRTPMSKERHGIVRTVGKDGKIREATYLRGTAHGLDLFYGETSVAVRLYKNGNVQASVWFDSRFKETYRDGVLLDKFIPESIRNPNHTPKSAEQKAEEDAAQRKAKAEKERLKLEKEEVEMRLMLDI